MNYQFKAHHIFIGKDDHSITIGFSDDEFSPSRFVLFQKSYDVDEGERSMSFDRMHILVEDESRSRYGGLVAVHAYDEKIVLWLDEAARSDLQVERDIEIAFQRDHPLRERVLSELKRICDEEAIPFDANSG